MTSPHALPPENIARGTVFALIALPLGVLAWLLIWSFGFVASIVAFAVAVAAAFFYRVGSGGRIGKLGGWLVTIVTVVTLAVAWFAGLALDVVRFISDNSGVSWINAFTGPYFSEFYALVLEDSEGDLVGSALLTILFGALGAFSVLRSVFRQAKADAAVPMATPPGFEPYPGTQPEPEPEQEPDAAK